MDPNYIPPEVTEFVNKKIEEDKKRNGSEMWTPEQKEILNNFILENNNNERLLEMVKILFYENDENAESIVDSIERGDFLEIHGFESAGRGRVFLEKQTRELKKQKEEWLRANQLPRSFDPYNRLAAAAAATANDDSDSNSDSDDDSDSDEKSTSVAETGLKGGKKRKRKTIRKRKSRRMKSRRRKTIKRRKSIRRRK